MDSLSPELLASTPVMPSPDGSAPVFDGPLTAIQIGTIVAFSVTFFFATVSIFLRYIQALKISKKLELDLIIITISYALSIFYFVAMNTSMDYGWGRHLWDVSLLDFIDLLKSLLPSNLAYFITLSITRFAMLAVLYHINPSKIYRYIVIGIAIVSFSYTLALCIIIGGPCNSSKLTTSSIASGSCLEKTTKAHAILNILSDLAVAVVPIPTLYGLNLLLKQKIMIGGILAVGSGVVVCSIARLPYVFLIDTTDVTHTEAILGIWSIVEVNLGILCVCAVRLKPLIKAYLPQLGLFSSRSRKNSQSWSKGIRGQKSSEQHSYQLHSIQRANEELEMDLERRDIRINRSYHVDVEYVGGENARDKDSASTKGILT